MGHISDSFTILYVALAAGIYLKPHYAIFNSRIVTAAVLFGIITVSRIVYQLVLYPGYFTPLKHIYSPAVGYSSLLWVREMCLIISRNDTGSGAIRQVSCLRLPMRSYGSR